MKELIQHPFVQRLIELAFAEDIGDGDHTSLACIPADAKGNTLIVAKEDGIIAGIELAVYIFHRINPHLSVTTLMKDGDTIKPGDVIMRISGSTIAMLTAERTVLNFMQRLSGISTQTKKYTEILKGLNTRILDTRKTTPGMRLLEKWAVRNGGGVNHRIGLYDMILLKDNHIDFAGGIKEAIARSHEYLKSKNLNLKIEVETRTLQEIQEVLECGGVDRIMLDNFSPQLLKEGVALINGRFETEASGGITLQTLRTYAESGVDFISSGALTHSVKSIDLSMRAG
jgi:nicotinate-nucleotide pyrophosphorylase (carboxylating)